MKNLRKYQQFDYEAFLKGKELIATSTRIDDGSKSGNPGLRVELCIVGDPTAENLYEKFTVKVDGAGQDYANKLPVGTKVRITEVQKASVWGDYSQNLTITGKLGLVGR